MIMEGLVLKFLTKRIQLPGQLVLLRVLSVH